MGKLRTFSAGGASKLEPSVDDFQRLMVFVHLTPVYEGRMFIRADGDDAGNDVVKKLKGKFPKLTEKQLTVFSKPQFEHFYPDIFTEKVKIALAYEDKKVRGAAKLTLLTEVLDWTRSNLVEAKSAWQISAAEPIELLNLISASLSF